MRLYLAATCQVGGVNNNWLRPLLENRSTFDSNLHSGDLVRGSNERGGRLDGVLTKNRGIFENLSSGTKRQKDMAGTVSQVACRERERERE